jgi:hypothetical protein
VTLYDAEMTRNTAHTKASRWLGRELDAATVANAAFDENQPGNILSA